jgi:hypothetical protein
MTGSFVFYAWPAGAQDVAPSVPHHVCNDASRLGEQVQATSAIRHDKSNQSMKVLNQDKSV